jgi:hypothetical protein
VNDRYRDKRDNMGLSCGPKQKKNKPKSKNNKREGKII